MRKVGAYVAIAVGGFLGLGVVLNAGGPHSLAALLLAFAVFCVAPIATGVLLLKGPDRRPRELQARRAWDSELMRLAARSDGSLTVAEVVAHADLDAAEAERYLDELCQRGICEHRVTDDGDVVYRFRQAPSADAKRAAKGVLDD